MEHDPADKISRRYACEPTLLTRLRADLPTDTTLSLAPYCHRTDKILCRYAYGTDYALAPYCYRPYDKLRAVLLPEPISLVLYCYTNR